MQLKNYIIHINIQSILIFVNILNKIYYHLQTTQQHNIRYLMLYNKLFIKLANYLQYDKNEKICSCS